MKIDLVKRRRVMERSQLLGHCICDPRRPCPCDVFREQGICPCAGERPDPVDVSKLRLMDFAHNAGCASKIAPADLDAVLSRLPPVTDPNVVSGLGAADDAAIYRIRNDLCLVQTVDVFTPCVDDPTLFGKICAANCLSDIYAMGGEPRTALSILAFPSETLDGQVMYRMLTGAMDTLAEAGVALVGGHSIKDSEIKLGFAVTGTIDPSVAQALEKPGAGDILVLTKPLGTGVLTFARQIGRNCDQGMAAAELSMAALNRSAATAMREAGASGCTDVTGFGLFGHLYRLARQGGVTARVSAAALPSFPGVLELLRDGVVPGAVERNREFLGEGIVADKGVDEVSIQLGCDAQTSGGLLIAVPPARLDRLREALSARETPCYVIGNCVGGEPGVTIQVKPQWAEPKPNPPLPYVPASDSDSNSMNSRTESGSHEGCCADAFSSPAKQTTETQRVFSEFMRSVQAPGALDARAKELIQLALVIFSRCSPCFAAHLSRARELGISQAEIDEAAWCAVSMGGAPVRMFYQEALKAASAQTAQGG
jgi:selenide,water dikinase